MPCPLLRKSSPCRCRAVSGEVTPPKVIVAALCRAEFQVCPAYRFIRAAGKPLHAADFDAWVVRGVPAGCSDGSPLPG
jgi:hypothetical protein